MPGAIGEHFQRETGPINFTGQAGYAIVGDNPSNVYPGTLDDDLPIRWLWSNRSNCSIISDEVLSRTSLKTSYPYNLTYRRLTQADHVDIRDLYTGTPFNVVGKIQVPLDLGDDIRVNHECFIVPVLHGDCVDVLLGMNFPQEYEFDVQFAGGRIRFVPRN